MSSTEVCDQLCRQLSAGIGAKKLNEPSCTGARTSHADKQLSPAPDSEASASAATMEKKYGWYRVISSLAKVLMTAHAIYEYRMAEKCWHNVKQSSAFVGRWTLSVSVSVSVSVSLSLSVSLCHSLSLSLCLFLSLSLSLSFSLCLTLSLGVAVRGWIMLFMLPMIISLVPWFNVLHFDAEYEHAHPIEVFTGALKGLNFKGKLGVRISKCVLAHSCDDRITELTVMSRRARLSHT
jgi:hypothetical protein